MHLDLVHLNKSCYTGVNCSSGYLLRLKLIWPYWDRLHQVSFTQYLLNHKKITKKHRMHDHTSDTWDETLPRKLLKHNSGVSSEGIKSAQSNTTDTTRAGLQHGSTLAALQADRTELRMRLDSRRSVNPRHPDSRGASPGQSQ